MHTNSKNTALAVKTYGKSVSLMVTGDNDAPANGFSQTVAMASPATTLTISGEERSDDEKISLIARHFGAIMEALGLDLTDDSLKGTPGRVARMYVKEVFSGLNPASKPPVSMFQNTYGYREMLVVKDVALYSYCERHFMPIVGKAQVGYIPNGRVIGLSKINRLVRYYARRPQTQERLSQQIAEGLKEVLETEHVAVRIEAVHIGIASRGVQDTQSSTTTAVFSGNFLMEETKMEFLSAVK